MTNNNQQSVRQSFGPNAEKYAKSAAFAKSESLDRLVNVVKPQAHWRVLDVATGGGHTARTIAPLVNRVVATDITSQMLIAARKMIDTNMIHNVDYNECDAQLLPFPRASFDLLTCRIAPHHFPDVKAFMGECARVVKPNGIVAIIDGIAPGKNFTARYLNAYEKLRDPSHVWQFNAQQWHSFFEAANLKVTLHETYRKAFEFHDYCERMNVPTLTRTQLKAMLLQAPQEAKSLYDIFERDGELWFHLHEVLIVGVRN
jgi:ubiquinone/menaquinone biosynthesis C-methylase UbiE